MPSIAIEKPLDLLEHVRELDRRLHGRESLVALLRAAPLHRLLQVLGGHHAVPHRHARLERDLRERARRGLDVFSVISEACAVAPCTTAPSATTASYDLDDASFPAVTGISYAPGTRTTSRSFSAPPRRRKASVAPFTSCSTRKELKRLATSATFKPFAFRFPAISFISLGSFR